MKKKVIIPFTGSICDILMMYRHSKIMLIFFSISQRCTAIPIYGKTTN